MVRIGKQYALQGLKHIQNYPKKRRRRTILKKRQRGGIFPVLALPFLLKK